MIRITGAAEAPQLVPILRQWYMDEWGKIESFAGNHAGYVIPEPLLAIDDKDELQGGLAFSTFDWPETGDTGVWINAVYVHPDCRGQQIATRLITCAESSARDMDIENLFVYTQIPDLYRKLGWQLASQTGADCVLTRPLPKKTGS